jgi:hypothetical protein
MPKGLRKAGKHFRVICQRPYPRAVEEVLISQRFNTLEEAENFVDAPPRRCRCPNESPA